MCRIIYGRISLDGKVISGTNDDDEALDFTVQRDKEDIRVYFKTPFKAPPTLTITPTYSEGALSDLRQGKQPGSIILISSDIKSFRVFASWESETTRPRHFNFSAMG